MTLQKLLSSLLRGSAVLAFFATIAGCPILADEKLPPVKVPDAVADSPEKMKTYTEPLAHT